MIRLGRVFGGLMVDVQAANAKLSRRSQSMLRHLSGRSSEEICAALAAADRGVKLAALLLNAKAVLERAGGQLRGAPAVIENLAPARGEPLKSE
jgi:N-acetylmuramic acid 6-phosphate etherase